MNDLNAEMSAPDQDGRAHPRRHRQRGHRHGAPSTATTSALLLQRADIAMYLAKERRSTIELYSVEHDQSMQRWLMLGGLLTHALEDGTELSLMYQPIGDVAVARHRAGRGAVPAGTTRCRVPSRRTSSSGSPSRWASSPRSPTSCWRRRARSWPAGARRASTIGLAINVSGREFADVNLVERVAEHLRANDLPARSPHARGDRDRGHGRPHPGEQSARPAVRASASRSPSTTTAPATRRWPTCTSFPVQELKIDRSFVTNLPNEASNRDHRPLLHRHGALARAEGRGRGRGGRAHVRHAGRRRVRLHPGLLPVEAAGGLGPAGMAPQWRHPRIRRRSPRFPTRTVRR